MKKLNKKGFTIVEMAIVVVVIGLAVGVGLFAKSRIDNNSSKAEAYQWVWCNYSDCYKTRRAGTVRSHRLVRNCGSNCLSSCRSGTLYFSPNGQWRCLGS